jgi:hypothetical protein
LVVTDRDGERRHSTCLSADPSSVLRETELFGRRPSAKVTPELSGNGLMAKTAFPQPRMLYRENEGWIA